MGYPVSFEYTGQAAIDDVLSAVEDAGRSYHDVNEWERGAEPVAKDVEKAAQSAADKFVAMAERIAALEAELAQLKQPAHVLAEAERLLRSVCALDVFFRECEVHLSCLKTDDTWSQSEGESLAEAYAKLTGGSDAG